MLSASILVYFVCINTQFNSNANFSDIILGVNSDVEKTIRQGIVPVSEYLLDRFAVSFDNTANEAFLFVCSELHTNKNVFCTKKL